MIKGEKIHRDTKHQKGLNIGETRDGGENSEHAPSLRNYNNTLNNITRADNIVIQNACIKKVQEIYAF